MKKRLVSLMVICAMLITMAFPVSAVYAQADIGKEAVATLDGKTVDGMDMQEVAEDSVMGSDVIEELEASGQMPRKTLSLFAFVNGWRQKSEHVWYNGSGRKLLTNTVHKGIDVSSHQKTIDWSKVKKSDVTFAIIRIGFGSNYKSQDDEYFRYNVEQCEKYGIPYGFYLYSYANTSAKNKSEINHVLRLIKGTKPTYPVYYDLEDGKTTGRCSNATIQKYALNYCKALEEEGYRPGIYASLYWWNKHLNTSSLDKYEKWVAQYNNDVTGCSYAKKIGIWQCASDYRMSGVSGKVDLNFSYKTYSKSYGLKSTSSSGSSSQSSQSSTSANKGWVTKNGKLYYYYKANKLYKSKWFTVGGNKYYATSKGYVYKSTYKKIGDYYYGFNSKGVMYKSTTTKIGGKTYKFAKSGRSILCKTVTTARVNYRTGTSIKKSVKGIYDKGDTVYVVRKKGDWWQATNGYWSNNDYLKVKTKYPR